MKTMVTILLAIFSLTFSVAVKAQTTGIIQCGDIVEGEVLAGQSLTAEAPMSWSDSPITFDSYLLEVVAGTRIDLAVNPLGNTFNPVVVLLDSGGNDIQAISESPAGEGEQLINYPLGSSNQIIRIMGAKPDGVGFERQGGYSPYDVTYNIGVGHYFGAYEIRLGCTLRDGTIILPGDATSPSEAVASSQTMMTEFSGFGFPGLAPVDFSAGIEIPLDLDQPQTIPIASDVALYTYGATADEVVTLSVSRVSGNISIGVTVINKDTNEIIFLGGLPSSNNLSVELTFPSEGTYAIGLFRLDTAERSGTSGAVQILLE